MGAVCITGADQVSSGGLGLQELAFALDAARGTAQALELDLPGPGSIPLPVCRVSAELPGGGRPPKCRWIATPAWPFM